MERARSVREEAELREWRNQERGESRERVGQEKVGRGRKNKGGIWQDREWEWAERRASIIDQSVIMKALARGGSRRET